MDGSREFIMKQLCVFAASAIVIVLAAAHVRSAGPTVLVVSLQRIATQSNAGKRAGQQLEALRQEGGRGLQAKQKELDDVVRQLAKDSLPQADRERLAQDESRRRAELQQLTTQVQTEFQATQNRVNTELRSQLTPILADIAKRAGVDVVMNADTIAWAAPGTDTTNEVIQRLNAAAPQ
jgi:Skp family chaperone for outer membrane proteins